MSLAVALAVLAAASPTFSPKIDNPWLPMKPGTTLVYRGRADGERVRDVVRVTHRTRMIDGARTRVVRDRVFTAGRLSERTRDYYAQDRRGNVWYFGEDTAELDRRGRVVTREGTWHAGVDGARAGLFMPAHPKVGERHRQETLRGHAEDRYEITDLHARVRTPYRRFRHALRTREWTRLEPGVVEAKFYVRGIGSVAERGVRRVHERLSLVAVRRG